MTDDKRAELVKFLLKNGHGWATRFTALRVSAMDVAAFVKVRNSLAADPYYIGHYDVLSDAWISKLSPLALKELADGS